MSAREHIAVTYVTDSMSACRGARVADSTESDAAEQHIAHGSDPRCVQCIEIGQQERDVREGVLHCTSS
jgi:hypothetical protein